MKLCLFKKLLNILIYILYKCKEIDGYPLSIYNPTLYTSDRVSLEGAEMNTYELDRLERKLAELKAEVEAKEKSAELSKELESWRGIYLSDIRLLKMSTPDEAKKEMLGFIKNEMEGIIIDISSDDEYDSVWRHMQSLCRIARKIVRS